MTLVESVIEINGKKIGINQPTYFIAEGGLNHNGDIKKAFEMIEVANNSPLVDRFIIKKTSQFYKILS